MSLLTTAQLTFCDLRDSYSIHVDTECIGVVCDNNGLVSESQTVEIYFRIFAGQTLVNAYCEVFDLPDGVTLVGSTISSSDSDGQIILNIAKGATLDNKLTSSMKVIFTTRNEEQFTFERYITFVKSMIGADGTDAVNFQIYSVDGFEFTDMLQSIELETIAFQSGIKLEDAGIAYQWKWWNAESTLDDKYEAISGATTPTFVVNIDDVYAFASIKCEMTYDGIVYEDYISLTQTTAIYTAMAKFFDGNNMIDTDEDYLIVYVELYKDNHPEELLYGSSVYRSDANTVQDNIISTDIDGEYVDGDMIYFVCKNTYDDIIEYDVILGQYVSSQWQVVESNYVYKNDLFINTTSPIVFVPKEKISRSLTVNFEIYNNSNVIARTSALLLDFNDPTISSTAPSNPQDGQLWLDTSVSPSILKMWDGTQWVNSGYQNGNVVYTSKPESGYSEGDLWILADGETCGDFGPGSMLKANTTSSTFDESHWEDAMEENTAVLNDVKQYFLFNKDTGLRIGQSNDKFYVNISSTEMGFYDATTGTAQKVVSISNQSAIIKNMTVNEGAVFNCEVQFGNFILKTESNGSLSLALAT